MKYEVWVGLEIHVELLTESKLFCGCSTAYGAEPNTRCCPVCLGLPGTLPVLNRKAIEYGIRTGIALDCQIAKRSKLDRKNYFYPDLPKAYQISQYDQPLCEKGFLSLEDGKRIGIRRIHIEEDAGKLLHQEDGTTWIDYNRAGVPLIEIVTEPDIRSSEEAAEFLENLKQILQYIEVSDCRMEQGSLRCDINVNVQSADASERSEIVEIKNLNSFKAVAKAIEYEAKRHINLLKEGKNTLKETRRWDESKNQTIGMRSKEGAEDYRYFPEPDLSAIEIDEEWIAEIRETLPELPRQRKERFIKDYGLSSYDAALLTASKETADFFEEVAERFHDKKMISNWMITELYGRLNRSGEEIKDLKFSAQDFANLLQLIDNKAISNHAAKEIFREMYETGKAPSQIVSEKDWKQISDEREIQLLVGKVIEENPQSVIDYKNGKDRALGFLVGQAMKASRGKANPKIVSKLMKEMIEQSELK